MGTDSMIVHRMKGKKLDAFFKLLKEYIVDGVFIDMCTRRLVTEKKLQSVLILSLENYRSITDSLLYKCGF
jgi:hypothetical protein